MIKSFRFYFWIFNFWKIKNCSIAAIMLRASDIPFFFRYLVIKIPLLDLKKFPKNKGKTFGFVLIPIL
jgi:hypothetical protein